MMISGLEYWRIPLYTSYMLQPPAPVPICAQPPVCWFCCFYRAYLDEMINRVFGPSSLHLVDKLKVSAASGEAINMEACFSQLTLDIIGKSVFNYDFNALNKDSPLIQAVYTALKETEQRATDLLPLWKVNLGMGGVILGYGVSTSLFFVAASSAGPMASFAMAYHEM